MEALEHLHPWIVVAVTIAIFLVLQLRKDVAIDILFLTALLVVTLTGVISPEQALAGFADPAVITIGALLVITAGLRSAGVLDWIGAKLLGSAQTERQALWRLAPTLITTSAFMLNTALVAMSMPVILDWCRRRHVSPSRLLMPLSFLVVLGGCCTLIGTSTTLVVQGLLRSEYQKQVQLRASDETLVPAAGTAEAERDAKFMAGVRPMNLFEIGYVGLPCAVAGALMLLLIGPKLLPNRTDMLEQLGEQRREYLVEMLVQPDCPLIGKTVESAGLRHLPGLFLIEIDRSGDIITPVTPEDHVHANDRLIFTGIVNTIVDLEKIPGLVPAVDRTYELHPRERQQRHLTEVVLSRSSPLIGRTVRQADFRRLYNAAVVAVHRNGVRLTNKIGNIALEPGDTLLLQTRNEFVPTYRNNRDFYLVSSVEGSQPRRLEKARLASLLTVALIVWLVICSLLDDAHIWTGIASPAAVAISALSIALLMVLSRCLPPSDARNGLDLQLLFVIAAALGLGKALGESGAARSAAEIVVSAVGQQPYLLLVMIYLLALVLTETLSNTAVAAMLIPLAIAVAGEAGYNPRPFIVAITLAASLSFMTPIGYQTTLMVMGPGGYRPSDYLRCGFPLTAIVTTTALILIPRIWDF